MKKTPPHLNLCRVKIDFDDEVYFRNAYYDSHSQTWRDAKSDNVLQNVKSWEKL